MQKEHLENVALSKIKPYSRNPRKNDKAVDYVCQSIQKNGYIAPIVTDEQFCILAGHTRFKALQKLKYKECDIIKISGLTEKQKKDYRIRDNKSSELAEWDFETLQVDFKPLELEDFGFDMQADFGIETEPDLKADEVPEIDKKKVICKTGDLWQLGKHRLLCGDSTKENDVKLLMDGKKANLILTSPPYWVGKDYEMQKNEIEINEFIRKIIANFNIAIQYDNSRIIINTGTGMATSLKEKKTRVILLLDKWINELYNIDWYLRHIRHWIKGGGNSNFPISAKTDYVFSGMEYLLTFYNINGKQRGQNKIFGNWVQQSNWNDIIGDKQENKAGFPIELPNRFILLYSLKNEIIYEPFLGNGTTIIACEKTNRICNGMEISPYYCDVILQRYYDYCGKDPIRIKDGKKFTELKNMVK